jgi:hypothetical protein
MISINNGLKIDNACLPLIFNFAVEYVIRDVRANQEGLKLNAKHHTFVYADGVNLLGNYAHTIKKNTEYLLVANKEIGL